MQNDRDNGRQPFSDGSTVREADPVANGMNINQATNHLSEILGANQGDKETPKVEKKAVEQGETPDVPVQDPVETQEAPQDDEDSPPKGGQPGDEEERAKSEDNAEEPPGNDAGSSEGEGEAAVDAYEIEPAVLAQFLGVEEDDLILSEYGGMAVKTKVDGKVSEVGIKELKDSYQLAKASQARMQTLAEEKKQFDTQKTEAMQTITGQQEYMTAALQAIENAYAQEFQQTDWQRLQSDDPDGYATRRQSFDQRMLQVQQFKQQFEGQIKQLNEQKESDQKTRWDAGFRKLNDTFSGKEYMHAPKWDDSAKEGLANYMVQAGMSPEAVGKVDNWLVFKWARDSMLRGKEMAIAEKTVKRVIKLPKVAKPGTATRTNKKSSKSKAVADAKSRQRKAAKTGYDPFSSKSNIKETADLISELIRS